MIDRRTFLTGVAATGVVACLSSCGGDDKKKKTPTGDPITTARDQVRASPDHLSARAAALVASKDYTGAVRFVRDAIAVVPPTFLTDDAVFGVRWGPDGALRAAAGTQRERADLLAAMLTAMGATATVKQATRPDGVDAAAIYSVQPSAFSVDLSQIAGITNDQRQQFQQQLDTPLDPDSSAVVAKLAGLLPIGAAVVANPFDGVTTPVPVVEYTVGGTTKWAFALGSVDEVTSAPAALSGALGPATYPTVSVRLLAALGDIPGVATSIGLTELAAGTWKTDQVAGSRLFVTTAGADPANAVDAPGAQVPLRNAVLHVQRSTAFADSALWNTGLSAAPQTFHGKPFTLAGAVLTPPASAGAPWTGPYGAISTLSTSDHAAAVSSVASLQAMADGGSFPDVRLSVSALNQSGQPVYGLTANDLQVTDESSPMLAQLTGNAAPNPMRVMLSFDCSGSIDWTSVGVDETTFKNTMGSALAAAADTNPYLIGVGVLGTRAGSYVTPNAATIAGDICPGPGFSELWYTLGEAAALDGVSAVVMVSDFQSSDVTGDIEGYKQRLRNLGLKVALVPIGTVDQATVSAIVDITGATVIDYTAGDFAQQITDFVTGVTGAAISSPYRLTYRVPDTQLGNQGTRSVGVKLATTSASATATYAVPPEGSRGVAGVVGLYLEVRIGSSATVVRHLAGAQIDRFGNPVPSTPDDVAAVEALLNGSIAVAFEPGEPTAAANLDDAFSGVLSLRPALDFGGKKASDVLPQVSGFAPYDSTLMAMSSPFARTTAMTAPQWLRVVIKTRSCSQAGTFDRIDVPPELNLSVAASTDGGAAFAANMAATVPLSVREGVVNHGSAAQALAGAQLQYLAPGANPSTLTGFTADDLTGQWSRILDYYSGWHRIVPITPSTGALWIVEPTTGSAVAVSLDGAGGSCRKSEADAAFQAALGVLQCFLAYKVLQCDAQGEEVEAAPSFACDGAIVGAVGATVAAIFAGALLEDDAGIDIFVATIALAIGIISSQAGWFLSLASLSFITVRAQMSIDENC